MQRATASSKAIFAWIPSLGAVSRAVQAAQIAAYRLGRAAACAVPAHPAGSWWPRRRAQPTHPV